MNLTSPEDELPDEETIVDEDQMNKLTYSRVKKINAIIRKIRLLQVDIQYSRLDQAVEELMMVRIQVVIDEPLEDEE